MKSLADRLEEIEGHLSTITILVTDMKEVIGGCFDREEESPVGNEEDWEDIPLNSEDEEEKETYVIFSKPLPRKFKPGLKRKRDPVLYYVPPWNRPKGKDSSPWIVGVDSKCLLDTIEEAEDELLEVDKPPKGYDKPMVISSMQLNKHFQ